jgi:hypothetical protein
MKEGSMEEKKNYRNESIGLFETTFRSGKLQGKKGYTGKISADQYNELLKKLAPGSTIFVTINEFKKEDKHPTFRLTVSEPRVENKGDF